MASQLWTVAKQLVRAQAGQMNTTLLGSSEAAPNPFDAALARIDLELVRIAQVRWCSPCSNSGQYRDDDGALGICTNCCCGECGTELDAFRGNCTNPKCSVLQ